MATLTVWKFGTWDGANQAIGTLESLAKQRMIKIHDAASVSWQPEKRRPRTRQVRNMTGPGAVGGAFWGMLFGTIFLMPFAGAAIGAAAGAVAGRLVDVGIDDDFIKEVRAQVTPGTSALFLLSSEEETDKVRETFRKTGLRAKLIHINLSDDQESAIHEMFDD
ncbi:DUF1269 domain-containing protein [Kribbella sp. NBC_00709]|uniref:DUF1269 domain-containing protein n=1 Tax=Kribbella sp. NBC_00709 TaxID=2975972 RepID=UPI002E2C7F81|nr:DUF1269 domain-containing protein [Kribbella sp. NBC_00709]